MYHDTDYTALILADEYSPARSARSTPNNATPSRWWASSSTHVDRYPPGEMFEMPIRSPRGRYSSRRTAPVVSSRLGHRRVLTSMCNLPGPSWLVYGAWNVRRTVLDALRCSMGANLGFCVKLREGDTARRSRTRRQDPVQSLVRQIHRSRLLHGFH